NNLFFGESFEHAIKVSEKFISIAGGRQHKLLAGYAFFLQKGKEKSNLIAKLDDDIKEIKQPSANASYGVNSDDISSAPKYWLTPKICL
ncbi:5742_t:CDS:2, partial [Ambispora gerdemannii]